MPRTQPVFAWMVMAMAGCSRAGVTSASFHTTGSDTTPRVFHAASLLPDGRVLVTGGMRLQLVPPSLISLHDVSLFDPRTLAFTPSRAALGTGRSAHTQTTLPDGRVLITGGFAGAGGQSPGLAVETCEIYDPATARFDAGPPMAVPRADHTATLLRDGRVVVAGGETWQVFDGSSGAGGVGGVGGWSPDVPLCRSRRAHADALIAGDRVLLIAGKGDGPATMEILDAASGRSVLSQAELPLPLDDVAAATLDDGTVLIVGGQNQVGGDTVGLAWVYEPRRDELSPVPGPPGVPHGVADHVLVTLGRGRHVLAAGGEQQVDGADTELDFAAIYDRAARGWTHELRMAHPHDDAAAVRLADGRVLIIGGGVGLAGQEVPSSHAEVLEGPPAGLARLP